MDLVDLEAVYGSDLPVDGIDNQNLKLQQNQKIRLHRKYCFVSLALFSDLISDFRFISDLI